MSVRVRIAPSPTGNLHIGTARTAVFNWLFARHHGGQFVLRVEDTDLERSRPEYTQNILDGLRWLGLEWDEGPFFQTQRLDLYQQAIKTLMDKGLAYRCYTTPEELEELRSAQKARGEAPRYDNRHRNLTAEQQAQFEAEGRTAVIRFKIDDDRQISWHDLVRGELAWQAKDLGGDMVIARSAQGNNIGQPLYNLAVVVDDIDMAITHVIRGEDHISNTPKQILLYEALEGKVPEFAHTPLILNQAGQKLSKRDGVTSISDFRDMGFIPPALVNYMTLLGWSPPDSQEVFTLEEAAAKFSFDRVNKAGAKFDWDKLDWLNSQYLHTMDWAKLTTLLIPYWQKAGYEFDPVAERPWLEQITALIGPSLTRLPDAAPMTRIFFQSTVEITAEGAEQIEQDGALKAMQAVLEGLDRFPEFTPDTAQELLKQVTKEQNVKKGLVMRSLRVAFTGDVHGPDLIQSWCILHQKGLDRIRLQALLSSQEPPNTPGNPPVEPMATTPEPEPNGGDSGADPPVAPMATTPDPEPTGGDLWADPPVAPMATTPEPEPKADESAAAPPVAPMATTPEPEVKAGESAAAPPVAPILPVLLVEPLAPQQATTAPPKPFPLSAKSTSEVLPIPPVAATTPIPKVVANPAPKVVTAPIPEPEMVVAPTPEVLAAPEPEPEMVATPEPEMVATPEPEMVATPEPEMVATPEPEMVATPEPEMVATPEPEMVAAPEPEMVATPEPEMVATPEPEMVATPEPEMVATPEPEMVATPEPEMVATPEPEMVMTALTNEAEVSSQTTITQKIIQTFSDLPDYITNFFGQYQKPILGVGSILAVIVGVRVIASVLHALNTTPLVGPIFTAIGLVYSGWFVYRYLLTSTSRQELFQKVKSLLAHISGQESPSA
uniref:Glutamate--tRNA ligase n=1 Tax=Planktothricoides sp. SpSt-374 TaxID=2282167 RepID=A0A7C3VS56_9CYAN